MKKPVAAKSTLMARCSTSTHSDGYISHEGSPTVAVSAITPPHKPIYADFTSILPPMHEERHPRQLDTEDWVQCILYSKSKHKLDCQYTDLHQNIFQTYAFPFTEDLE